MADYLAPQSQSHAFAFSSRIHAVLDKDSPMGAEMVQAGQVWSWLAWTKVSWAIFLLPLSRGVATGDSIQ